MIGLVRFRQALLLIRIRLIFQLSRLALGGVGDLFLLLLQRGLLQIRSHSTNFVISLLVAVGAVRGSRASSLGSLLSLQLLDFLLGLLDVLMT